MRSLTR